ncbi:MAG: response regulator [Betaproteobacteria bacterium]|nr:response regulator [Betaproteobacteria bacterium]
MRTILAVDDSPSIRQMVAFTLKGAGYEVFEAHDGQDGLEKAKARKADLVLTEPARQRRAIAGGTRAAHHHQHLDGGAGGGIHLDAAGAVIGDSRHAAPDGWRATGGR